METSKNETFIQGFKKLQSKTVMAVAHPGKT
jgi:hypothetical protein